MTHGRNWPGRRDLSLSPRSGGQHTLAGDERGRYRGLYEWDGPRRADDYARALWRVLALVSVPGSIHYIVLPGRRRAELLGQQLPASTAAAGAAAWWRPVEVS